MIQALVIMLWLFILMIYYIFKHRKYVCWEMNTDDKGLKEFDRTDEQACKVGHVVMPVLSWGPRKDFHHKLLIVKEK